jgi:glycosyltransferase involved in cell wall biosynthesis
LSSRADHGGGPAHVLQLTSGLLRRFRCLIACPREAPYWRTYADLLGHDNLLEIPHRRWSVQSVAQIASFARRHGVSLLHSHGKGAGSLARAAAMLSGLPCVHTFHGVHLERLGALGRRLYAAYETASSWRSAAIVAVSPGEAGMIAALGISTSKIHMIPNGIDPGPDPMPPPADGTFRVGVVTRFDPAKNSRLLIPIGTAWRKLNPARDWRFEIFGDGPARLQVQDAANAARLADRFAFHGFVPSARSRIADCHCLLSTSIREGLPLNLIEAAMAGRPIVASNVIGNTDVLRSVGGMAFPLDDPTLAATCLESLASDPIRTASLGREARMRASTAFSSSAMVSAMAELYAQVLSSRVARRSAPCA